MSNTIHDIKSGDTIQFSDIAVAAGKELPAAKIDSASAFHKLDMSVVPGGPGNSSTNSTSFVQLPFLALGITLAQQADVWFCFQGTFDTDWAPTSIRVRPKIGATLGNVWEHNLAFANSWGGIQFVDIFADVAAGTYTFDMDWAAGSVGGGTIRAHTNRRSFTVYAVYNG